MAPKYKIPMIKAKEINDPEIVTLIKNNNPDLIISFYFDQVIRKDIIGIPETDIINVHVSMLPRCRGPFPILCSVLEGISGGITIHSIQDEVLDTGPVYTQASYDLNINMDILSHDRKSMLTGADMVIGLVRAMEEGTISPKKQEESGSYMSFPTKRDIKFLELQGIKLFRIKRFLKGFIK